MGNLVVGQLRSLTKLCALAVPATSSMDTGAIARGGAGFIAGGVKVYL
jgi:hypothetical protein